jgi:hypothetical protein
MAFRSNPSADRRRARRTGPLMASSRLGLGLSAAARLPVQAVGQRLGSIAGLAKLHRADEVSAGEGS